MFVLTPALLAMLVQLRPLSHEWHMGWTTWGVPQYWYMTKYAVQV